MLIEFTVGNYRSFRDRVSLSMVAAKLASKDKALDTNNVAAVPGQPELLKSAVIYGANASGKSNLIRAMRFMKRFVESSSRGTEPTGGIAVHPFRLNPSAAEQPSHFEIVFIQEGQRYRYGFEATTDRVVSEWLHVVPKRLETLLFKRNLDEITLGAGFKEGRMLQDRTRPNALFLSVVAQFNGPIAQSVTRWFEGVRVASGTTDFNVPALTLRKLMNGQDNEDIIRLITKLDLGITDVRTVKGPAESPTFPKDMPEAMRQALETLIRSGGDPSSRVDVKTVHNTFDDSGQLAGNIEFDLDKHESAGTQKLFALAGPLVTSLKNGQVLIVDELDSSLHPTLTHEIVRLFNSNETNTKHAQFVFTTQDTSLLSNSLFRRDQVWFVEKNSRGASDLYSLAEFKGVRNDLALEPSYMQGRFGAVPYPELFTTMTEGQAEHGAEA